MITRSMQALLALILIVGQTWVNGVEQFGGESVIPLPPSAHYSRYINFKPYDKEIVEFNPPVFSWLYAPMKDMGEASQMAFRFQVSGDPDFKELYVDEVRAYNFFNTLKPFPSNKCWWRVGYIDLGNDSKTAPGPEARVSQWSSVRSFTIKEDAVLWDRSMLMDTAYTASKKHPRIIVHPESIKRLRDRIKNNEGAKKLYEKLRSKAKRAVSSGWWKSAVKGDAKGAKLGINWRDPKGPRKGLSISTRLGSLAAAAFEYHVSGELDPKKHGHDKVLVMLAREYLETKRCWRDPTRDDVSCPIIMLGFTYDWLYDFLAPEQRAVVVQAIDQTCNWALNHFWWKRGIKGVQRGVKKMRSWNYGREREAGVDPSNGEHMVPAYMGGKVGSSHEAEGFNKAMFGALAVYDEKDAPWGKKLFEVGTNYLIGKTYAFGYRDGGFMEGPGYVFSVLPQAVELTILMHQMFPEAKLNLNPYFHRSSRFFRHYFPSGLPGCLPWANVNKHPSDAKYGSIAEALGMLAGDGSALHHFKQTGGWSTSEIYIDLICPVIFPDTPKGEDKAKAAVFPHSGWAMARNLPVSQPNCDDDAVGIIFNARPQGAYSKAFYNDGFPMMYAYGQGLAFGEARMRIGGNLKHSMSHTTILVNGIGQSQKGYTGYYADKSFFGRIVAFKEGKDAVYFAGDITNCYASEKISPSPWMYRTNRKLRAIYENADLGFLRKVRRHVLFVKGKYFILFDELKTEGTPATFSWLYHVTEDTLAYEAAEQFFKWQINGVKIHMTHIANRNKLEVRDLGGGEVWKNPLTGEEFKRKGALKPDELASRHRLWISNKQKATDFHFMTVIYPIKPGTGEPRIHRINDHTARIEAHGETDIVTFDPANNQDATIRVDLTSISARDEEVLIGTLDNGNAGL